MFWSIFDDFTIRVNFELNLSNKEWCIAELHDAVFVVGALDEALLLRGMRYHPVDIEATVIRAHKMIIEW